MSSVVETLLEKLNASNKLADVLESRGTDLDGDKVISLDLSQLNLENLPAGVFDDLSDLKKLNLAQNKLTTVDPKTFSSLSNLTFLSLYANEISELSETFLPTFPNLEWLDLRENALTKVPKSVLELKKLNYLYLQNNHGLTTDEYDFSQDYHTKRDVSKFFEAFQTATGTAPKASPAKKTTKKAPAKTEEKAE